ncbi:cell division protein DIVIC [Bacillus sp. FJAT-27225]|uniref:FtsB family cell division protein n=1 Tax=Bacillus sp. FJAT-27225 TaxID=1743144 RepID=UPI00080C30C2|nr:septum formation initiator family protein [Bacillus sp. FJAT-27225]OCA80685.1 cell division protein DIVIC [Bacillus sp. FJAT-27225]
MGATKKTNVARIKNEYSEAKHLSSEAALRKRKGLIRRLSAFALLAALLTYFTISSMYTRATMLEDKKAEKERLHHQLSELKHEREVLKEEIKKLNDDEYLAKYARKEYFYSDEGEIIFTLPDDENKKEK